MHGHTNAKFCSHYLYCAFPANHKYQTLFHAFSCYAKLIFRQTASCSVMKNLFICALNKFTIHAPKIPGVITTSPDPHIITLKQIIFDL